MTTELEKQFCDHFKEGRLSPYPLWSYWVGVDGKTGHLGREWADKPHRLVFDLLHHAVAQDATIASLTAMLAEVVEDRDECVAGYIAKLREVGRERNELEANEIAYDELVRREKAARTAAEARIAVLEAERDALQDEVTDAINGLRQWQSSMIQVGWAYQDARWLDEGRWHLCGRGSKPREFEGRTVTPVFRAALASGGGQ